MAKTKLEGISVTELEKKLKKKEFAPLYFFVGEEEFLVAEGLESLREHVVEKDTQSFNLDIFYGNEIDARRIVETASSYPMMAERRLVIVKEFDKATNKEALIPYLEKPSPSTSLALYAAKTDFRQKVFELLKQNALIIECNIPYANEMPEWIQKRVKKMGKTISEEASALLYARTASALRIIQSEIDKLFIYVGEKTEIGVSDIEEVVGLSKQFNIFELQKALGMIDVRKTLEISERMLDSGESPIGMNIMLTRYFQKIQLCHEFRTQKADDFSVARQLGVSPKFVGDYYQAAKNFNPEDVNRSFRYLLEADEAIKSSADEKVTMTTLLYKIMKKVDTANFEDL